MIFTNNKTLFALLTKRIIYLSTKVTGITQLTMKFISLNWQLLNNITNRAKIHIFKLSQTTMLTQLEVCIKYIFFLTKITKNCFQLKQVIRSIIMTLTASSLKVTNLTQEMYSIN